MVFISAAVKAVCEMPEMIKIYLDFKSCDTTLDPKRFSEAPDAKSLAGGITSRCMKKFTYMRDSIAMRPTEGVEI
jgi:hypothetical protein